MIGTFEDAVLLASRKAGYYENPKVVYPPKEKKGLLVRKPKDLISHILINAEDRDIYLIKGSNSIGLSFIVDKLYDLNNGCF